MKELKADKAFAELKNEMIKRISEIEKEFNCKFTYLSLRKLYSDDINISKYKSWIEYEAD
ncbi:MAG: hypothetical protein ACOYMA_12240 [Bacteroidia bacterium]